MLTPPIAPLTSAAFFFCSSWMRTYSVRVRVRVRVTVTVTVTVTVRRRLVDAHLVGIEQCER